jgi:hypothetical protein
MHAQQCAQLAMRDAVNSAQIAKQQSFIQVSVEIVLSINVHVAIVYSAQGLLLYMHAKYSTAK